MVNAILAVKQGVAGLEQIVVINFTDIVFALDIGSVELEIF